MDAAIKFTATDPIVPVGFVRPARRSAHVTLPVSMISALSAVAVGDRDSGATIALKGPAVATKVLRPGAPSALPQPALFGNAQRV